MKHLVMIGGALAMAVAAPAIAQGHGKDHGRDKGHSQDKGHGQDKAKGKYKPQAKRDDHRRDVRSEARRDDREVHRYADRDRGRTDVRRFVRVGAITGCPPGLAKKRNGCLPPGQAKKLYARNDRYAAFFNGVPSRYRSDYGNDYRYRDGYLYRTSGNSIVSWLPVLGGALGVGRVLPARYASEPLPDYYRSYYTRNNDYAYRYADRAIFAVDPQTRTIQSIAALLTGDDWTVGQRTPAGYGAYNVPLSYRDRYVDTPGANYRYADGQIYRIDPKTQLIASAISLLT